MDVLLENGDIVCGHDGTPVMIGGARELAPVSYTHLRLRANGPRCVKRRPNASRSFCQWMQTRTGCG